MTDRPGKVRFTRPLLSSTRRAGTEITLVVLLVGLAVGLLFGKGIAQTVLHTSDGLVWLSDSKHGQVVQVNPDTGRPENRLQVGTPGDDIDVAQRDGFLITTDRRTGVVTVIDLSTLLISGQRRAGTGTATKVLVCAGHIYLADRSAGTLEQIDPLSAATVGQTWFAGGPLADAAVDGSDTVWVLESGGRVVALHWSDAVRRFVQQQDRPVDGTGSDAVLVAHDRGVTVLSPGTGAIVQVGTGDDHATVASSLGSPLHAADTSPADLVPASVEATSTVVVARGDHVLQVDVSRLGCDRPGTPVTYRDMVYVPCLGARKIIVLTPDGQSGGPDILTPEGSDPQLVVDDGVLIVNVPGADTGVLVAPDGSTRTITLRDPGAPVHDPGKRPTATALPPGMGDRPSRSPKHGVPVPGQGGGDRTSAPTTTPTTTPPPPVGAGPVPVGVTAQARGDGSILVSWTPGSPAPDSYRVLRSGTTETEVATAAGGARSAIVTAVAPGDSASFVVEAAAGTRTYRSAPSGAVTAYSRPGAPVNLRASVAGRDSNAVTVEVAWDAVPANGSAPNGYDVTVTGNFATSPNQSTGQPIGQQPYRLTVPCAGSSFCTGGGALDIDIAINNAAGTGPSARVHLDVPAVPPPPPPLPPAGAAVITRGIGAYDDSSGTSDVSLTLAPPAGWATFGGTCEIVGTRGTVTAVQAPVGCADTSATVTVDGAGRFQFVVRAHAAGDPSRTADSAVFLVTVRIPPTPRCTPRICPNQPNGALDRTPVPLAPLAAFPALLGLAFGAWITARRRLRKEPQE